MLLFKRGKGLTGGNSKLQPKSNTEYTDDASGLAVMTSASITSGQFSLSLSGRRQSILTLSDSWPLQVKF